MSWSNYIVDHERKVLVECGRVGWQELSEEAEIWESITCKVFDRVPFDTVVKLRDVSVQEAIKLIEAETIVNNMSSLSTRVLALAYMRMHEIIPSPDNVIGEDLIDDKKYKGYALI